MTEEAIRTSVLTVASGTFRISDALSYMCPSIMPGHAGAPILRKMYAEKSPPKSMISEARNSQTPILAL